MRQVRLHDRDLVQSSRRIRRPLLVFIQDELNEELNDVLKLIVQGCPDEVWSIKTAIRAFFPFVHLIQVPINVI